MQYNELRQFIRDANAARLSPCEKDVFLYYYSCTQNENGVWHCDDTATAAEIGRSRNRVCEARLSLIKKHKWIAENGQFNIRILKKFSVENSTDDNNPVENSTEKPCSESESRLDNEMSVENSTQDSVENSTPIYDKQNSFSGSENDKEEEEKHTQNPCARKTGDFPLAATEPESAENFGDFRRIVLSGIAAALSVKQLPNKDDWLEWLQWAHSESYTSLHALEVYSLMSRQKWRKSPVSPKDWAKNLPNLKKLRIEIEEQDNEQKPKPSNREQRAIDEHLAIEQVREHNRQRREQLRTRNA